MSATTSPLFLRKLVRLALEKPEHQRLLMPILRQRAASVLSEKARLRVALRRAASQFSDPKLGLQIAEALDGKSARFEEGKSVDVAKWLRDKGLDEAADEWEENTEKYGDKFKS